MKAYISGSQGVGVDIASAVNRIVVEGIILKLTATLPLKVIAQYSRVPVKGKFPLPTLPGLSEPEMAWVEYLGRADSRMSKAWKLFAEGMEDEAGEEAWRAAIDAIHAITSLAWGKIVRSHTGLKRVVSLLEREGIVKIASEFGNVESLHNNYYEPGYDRYMIRKYLEYAERLIRKVKEAAAELMVSATMISQLDNLMTRVIETSLKTILKVYPDLSLPRRRRRQF